MRKVKLLSAFEYFSIIIIVSALFIAFLLFSSISFNEYTLTVLGNIYIFIILAVSYNLINGVAGQFSLEPNGFVAIGAYVTAILMLSPEMKDEMFVLNSPYPFIHDIYLPNPFLALIISGTISAVIAFFISFPVFRVRGDYLAIVTLGFGFIIRTILLNYPSLSNGAMGIDSIPNFANYVWIGVTALIIVILVYNIVFSKFGRAMRAVKNDEDAAMLMGIHTFRIKTLAFVISAFFEGIGGGLMASFIGSISPDQFTFIMTFQLLIIIVIGGLGSVSGSILSTILFFGGMEILRPLDDSMWSFGFIHGIPGLRMVIFSFILILLLLFAKKGLFGEREIWDVAKDLFKKIKLKRSKNE